MNAIRNPRQHFGVLGACLLAVVAVGFAARAEAPEGAAGRESGAASGRESGAASGAVFSDFPLYFVENRGQLAEGVAFYLEGRETSVYFTPQGLTYALTGSRDLRPLNAAARTVSYAGPAEHAEAVSRWAVKLDFVAADPNVTPRGSQKTPAVVSYFKGPQAKKQSGLATYREVIYRDLWPGVDLIYSGTVNRLKYQFVVNPGADPAVIRLAYRGADVRLNGAGQLEVSTPVGGFRDDKPYVYQEHGGRRVAIPAAYSVEAADNEERVRYGFALGNYDPSLPLIIDPSVLIYAGYIGGTALDRGADVAVDSAGNAYVTGETAGTAGFPAAAGPDLTFNGDTDAFVAKVNAAGTALIYAGYLGGSGADRGASIAVDGAGAAYITGETESDATTFPTLLGPDLT